MMIWLINVLHLCVKELRCVLRDRTMMGAIVVSFTIAIYVVATGANADVTNVSFGIIDHDRSGLSMRIRQAIRPRCFRNPSSWMPSRLSKP